MFWCSGAPTPQRIRRFACLKDYLLTLTCHLAKSKRKFQGNTKISRYNRLWETCRLGNLLFNYFDNYFSVFVPQRHVMVQAHFLSFFLLHGTLKIGPSLPRISRNPDFLTWVPGSTGTGMLWESAHGKEKGYCWKPQKMTRRVWVSGELVVTERLGIDSLDETQVRCPSGGLIFECRWIPILFSGPWWHDGCGGGCMEKCGHTRTLRTESATLCFYCKR